MTESIRTSTLPSTIMTNGLNRNAWSSLKESCGIIINKSIIDSLDLYLVPIVKNGKIGFINSIAEVVIEPRYDNIDGQFNDEENYVCVARIEDKGNEFWGVIDVRGINIVPCEHKKVFVYKKRFIGCNNASYSELIDGMTKEVLIPRGKYELLSYWNAVDVIMTYLPKEKTEKGKFISTKKTIVNELSQKLLEDYCIGNFSLREIVSNTKQKWIRGIYYSQ